VHEGTKCTRKFGNPKAAVFGTAARTSAFDQNAAKKNFAPGPGRYDAKVEVNRFRSSSPLFNTTEPRMKH
jgi:hypothetical protein